MEHRLCVWLWASCSLHQSQEVFDSVHHDLLRKIQRLKGNSTKITGLIRSLFSGTESAVKYGYSEVRHGYILAPTISNTCMEWKMGRASIQGYCWATKGNIKVTYLVFSEDVAILNLWNLWQHLLVHLSMRWSSLSSETKPLHLEVSWIKTKMQDFVG